VTVAVVVSGSGCASGELKLIGAAGGNGLTGKDAADDLDPSGFAVPKGDGAPLELTGLDLYEDGLAARFADNGGERDGDGRARCADANTDAGRRPEVGRLSIDHAYLVIQGWQGAVGRRRNGLHLALENAVAEPYDNGLAESKRRKGLDHGATAYNEPSEVGNLGEGLTRLDHRAEGGEIAEQRTLEGSDQGDATRSGDQRLENDDRGASLDEAARGELDLHDASGRGGGEKGARREGGANGAAQFGFGTHGPNLRTGSLQPKVTTSLRADGDGSDLGGARLGPMGVALSG
jgi:hypothetical protein